MEGKYRVSNMGLGLLCETFAGWMTKFNKIIFWH